MIVGLGTGAVYEITETQLFIQSNSQNFDSTFYLNSDPINSDCLGKTSSLIRNEHTLSSRTIYFQF